MGLGNDIQVANVSGMHIGHSPTRYHARRLNTIPLRANWWEECFTSGRKISGPAAIKYTIDPNKPVVLAPEKARNPYPVNTKKNALNDPTDLNYSYADHPTDAPGVTLTGQSRKVYEALQNAGFIEPNLKLVWLMCYMESGAWTNGPATRDNNPGNIMWSTKSKWPKGVYVSSNKTYAIHFNSLDQFASYLLQLLSTGSRPIDATTMADFVHRLKLNNYFGTTSEAAYLQAMKGAAQRLRLQAYLTADTNQKIVTPDSGNWFKDHPLVTGAGAAILGLLLIKTLAR